LIPTLHHSGKSKEDIPQIIGTSSLKYIGLIEEGKKKKPDDFIGVKLTDDDMCKAFGAIYTSN